MSTMIGHFIGGQAIAGRSGRAADVFDPALGVMVGKCSLASADEVAQAVSDSAQAAKQWAATSQKNRRTVIFNMRELVLRNTERLIQAICIEHGKKRRDAAAEISRALESIECAATAAELMKGEFSSNIGGNIDNFSILQPVGVVACIVPFNFPVLLPLVMGSMAVATGNAVVIKPSERTPSASIILAELWKEAGLPNGVWNIVNGDKDAVNALIRHSDVDAITFVGSTRVGEYVYQEGTRHNKRVACFTGGKNHMVVMPDADLEFAADCFVSGAYGDAGQRCMAVSVLVPIGEEVGDKLSEKVAQRVRKLRPGRFDDERADFGPVITKQTRESIIESIADCITRGATVLADGRSVAFEGSQDGFFLGATLLDNVDTGTPYYQEEVFGPARAIVRTSQLDEAINLINRHAYGNGAAIFTQDGGVARHFYEDVEAGGIGINVPVPLAAGTHDFAGLKKSKFGEAFLFGPSSIPFLTKQKTITSRWAVGTG